MARGRTAPNIKRDAMEKVWALYGKGVDNATISAVVGISAPSVYRIIEIMKLAKAHDVEGLCEYRNGNNIAQKRMACKHFGYDFDAELRSVELPKVNEPVQITTDDIIGEKPNFTPFESAVLACLSEMNMRLTQICAALDIE